MAIPNDGDGGSAGNSNGNGSAGQTNHERSDLSDRLDHDYLGGDDGELSCRATGQDDLSDLLDRSTGTSDSFGTDSDSPADGALGDSINLLGDRPDQNFHLMPELYEPNPFGLESLGSSLPGFGERTGTWVGLDGGDPLGGYGDALAGWNDFSKGIDDFFKNFDAMVAAGWKGADRYFHCMANCEASSRGPGGELAAKLMSIGRETFDSVKNVVKGMSWRDSIADCRGDMAANRVGQQAGHAGERCYDACRPLRPRGFNPD